MLTKNRGKAEKESCFVRRKRGIHERREQYAGVDEQIIGGKQSVLYGEPERILLQIGG